MTEDEIAEIICQHLFARSFTWLQNSPTVTAEVHTNQILGIASAVCRWFNR